MLPTEVRGTFAKPVVNGRLELHNASLNYTEIPNGITNANGVVLFNGNNAYPGLLAGSVSEDFMSCWMLSEIHLTRLVGTVNKYKKTYL